MSRIALTVRRGAQVSRQRFDHLDEAFAALERVAAEVSAGDRLEAISAFRDFEPGDRVSARLEISIGRMLRSRAAGIDVMGDGSLIPFTGGITRQPLKVRGRETALGAVRRELNGLS